MNKKSPTYILFFMAAICIVFGLGISVVNYATQGLLAKNATLHLNSVLCHAFRLDVTGTSAEAYQQAVDKYLQTRTIGDRLFYTCTAPGNESVGFIAGGMGFWDRIDCVVVLSPDLKQVLNIQVLDQKETPGLGARIEEPWFTKQFEDLTIAWDAPKDNRILIGTSPSDNAPNEVDAITGATQTSMSLMRFLNDELDLARSLYSSPLASTAEPSSSPTVNVEP